MANLQKYQIYYRCPGVYDWTLQSDKWFGWHASFFLWWVRHTEPLLDEVEFKVVKDGWLEVKTVPVKND